MKPMTKEERKLYMQEYRKRLEAQRVNTPVNDPVNAVNTPVNVNSPVNSVNWPDLTPTDRKFDKSNPSYYIFDSPMKTRVCIQCDTKFSTHLDMNKFCSPACKNQFLKVLVTL